MRSILCAMLLVPLAASAAVTFTAQDQGYYIVTCDGTQESQHTQEREALESATNLELQGRDCTVTHDYEVSIEVDPPDGTADDGTTDGDTTDDTTDGGTTDGGDTTTDDPFRLVNADTGEVVHTSADLDKVLNPVLHDRFDGIDSIGNWIIEVGCGTHTQSFGYSRRWTDYEKDGPINLHIKAAEGCAQRPHLKHPPDQQGNSTVSFHDQNAGKWQAQFRITGLEISGSNFECVDTNEGYTRLEIRDSYLHHCAKHVLQPGRPKTEGTVVVENSELAFGPKLHNTYIVGGISRAEFRGNVIHSPDGGHAVKCLADTCIIEGNTISNVGPDGNVITSSVPMSTEEKVYVGTDTIEVWACTDSVIRDNRIIFREELELEGKWRQAIRISNRVWNGGCNKPKYDTAEYWNPDTWANPDPFTHIIEGNEFVCVNCSGEGTVDAVQTQGTNRQDRDGQLNLPDVWVERSVVLHANNTFEGFTSVFREDNSPASDDTVIPKQPIVEASDPQSVDWTVEDMPGLLRTDVDYVVSTDSTAGGGTTEPETFASIVSGMPAESWTALPVDEKFRSETQKTEQEYNDAFVAEGFDGINPANFGYSVIAAWSGGAYSPERDRHFHWGAGHSAYDNGIYAFDLADLEWHRIQPPIPDRTCDVAPLATHSYDTVEYWQGYLYVVNHKSSGDPCLDYAKEQGNSTRDNYGFWRYDLDGGNWERLMVDYRNAPGMPECCANLFGGADIVGDWYIIIDRAHYFSYNLKTGEAKGGTLPGVSWIRSGSAAYGNGYMVRHSADGENPGGLTVFTIDNGVPLETDISVSGTLSQHAGIDYDPDTKKFWLWNDGCKVQSVDSTDWSVQTYPNDGCPVVEGDTVGPYGNWQYLSDHGVFLGINNTDGPNGAYIWKP